MAMANFSSTEWGHSLEFCAQECVLFQYYLLTSHFIPDFQLHFAPKHFQNERALWKIIIYLNIIGYVGCDSYYCYLTKYGPADLSRQYLTLLKRSISQRMAGSSIPRQCASTSVPDSDCLRSRSSRTISSPSSPPTVKTREIWSSRQAAAGRPSCRVNSRHFQLAVVAPGMEPRMTHLPF